MTPKNCSIWPEKPQNYCYTKCAELDTDQLPSCLFFSIMVLYICPKGPELKPWCDHKYFGHVSRPSSANRVQTFFIPSRLGVFWVWVWYKYQVSHKIF